MSQLTDLIQHIAQRSHQALNRRCAQELLDRNEPLSLSEVNVRRLVIRSIANPEQAEIRDRAVELLCLNINDLISQGLLVPARALFGLLLHGPRDVRSIILTHIMVINDHPHLPAEIKHELYTTLTEVMEYDPLPELQAQAEGYLQQLAS